MPVSIRVTGGVHFNALRESTDRRTNHISPPPTMTGLVPQKEVLEFRFDTETLTTSSCDW